MLLTADYGRHESLYKLSRAKNSRTVLIALTPSHVEQLYLSFQTILFVSEGRPRSCGLLIYTFGDLPFRLPQFDMISGDDRHMGYKLRRVSCWPECLAKCRMPERETSLIPRRR